MKYDVKMNIKRALSLYLATSVIATNPGTIAAATALIDTKEETTAVVSEVVEVEEYLEDTTEIVVEEATEEEAIEEEATEEVATEEEATEEEATEEVATEEVATEEVATEEVATEEVATEVVEEAPATMEMSLDVDAPTSISYVGNPHLDWNSTTVVNFAVKDIDEYTWKTAAGSVTPVPRVMMRDASGASYTGKYLTDYKLEYSNNDTLGEGTIKIIGLGIYEGQSYDYKFNIVGQLNNCTIALNGDNNTTGSAVANSGFTYTGSAINPEPTVTLYDKVLTKGVDYNVTYTNDSSSAVGSYTMTITNVAGRTGGKPSVTYTIDGMALSSCASVADVTPIGYLSGAVTPEPVVTLTKAVGSAASGDELVKGTDYTVTYSNNTGVGTGTMTITGKGNYSGTITKDFTIKDNSDTNLFDETIGDLTVSDLTFAVFNGSAQLTPANFTPTVQYFNSTVNKSSVIKEGVWWTSHLIYADDADGADDIGELLAKIASGTASDAEVAEVAESKEKAGYPGGNNYYVVAGMSSFSGSWHVTNVPIYGNMKLAIATPKTAATDTTETSNWTWDDGNDVKPTYWDVKIGNFEVDQADFEVIYPEDVSSVGSKTVTISYTGTPAAADGSASSYYYNTATKAYNVVAATFSVDHVEDVTDGVYDTALQFTGAPVEPEFKITLTDPSESTKVYLTKDVDYTVSCKKNVSIGTETATATITGIGGYAGVSFTIPFSIVASTDYNVFGEDESTSEADGSKLSYDELGFLIFKGTPLTANDLNPTISWNYTGDKTVTLVKGTYYDAYLIKDFTDFDVDAYAQDLVAGTADLSAYQTGLDSAGTPGKNYYVMIGTGDAAGAYWYDEVSVYGNLKLSTITPLKNTGTAEAPTWVEAANWDWTGADVQPDAWEVKIGDYVLTSGTNYQVTYPSDLISVGTKTVTIATDNPADGNTPNSYFYNSLTKDYTVDAITFDVDDIYGGVTDGVLDSTSLFTGVAVVPDIYIWKNGVVADVDPTVANDAEHFLVKDVDYKYTCTNNISVGTATATITGLGGYAGVNFTVDFDIVADLDTNQFKDTVTFTNVKDQAFYGDAIVSTDLNASASCAFAPGKTAALVEGTLMNSMLVNLGTGFDASTLDGDGLDTLLGTILGEIDANAADSQVAISDTVQGYIDAAGLPGLNLFIVRGADSFEGSYAAAPFSVKAMLKDATLTWYDKDPAGTYDAGAEAVAVDDYYVLTSAVFPQLTLKNYVIPASQYTILPTDTSITDLNSLTASSGTKSVSIAAASADSFSSGTNTGEVVIKGYSFEDEDATVDITVETALDYRGYTLSNAPTGFDFALGAYTHDDLVRNVDYTVTYLNAKDVALGTSTTNPPTVVITGMGIYEGTVEKTFDIVLNAASSITVEEIPTQEYANASAITPTPKVTVTVTDDADESAATYIETYTLEEGTDFLYGYAGNYLCGVDTASVTITLLGNYAGMTAVTETFSIAASMEDVVVSNIAAQEYTAEEVSLTYDDQALATSDFTIKYNNTDLVMSSKTLAEVAAGDVAFAASGDEADLVPHDGDFYMTYEDNTDIGTATVTFHAVDGSAFHGTTSATFEIETIALTDYEVKIADDAEVGFTGDYVTPKFTLEYKAPAASSYALATPTPTLTEGTDYTVEYFNNVNVADGSAETFTNGSAGVITPYIKVTGAGIYEGSVVYGGFEIEAGAYNLFEGGSPAGLIATKAYDGAEQTQTLPAMSITDPLTGGTKNIFLGTHYTIGGSITDVLGLPDGTVGSHTAGNYTSGDGALATNGYTGNSLPGEATVYLIGIGDYVDSYLEVNFDVVADLSKAAIYYKNSTAITGSDTESATGTYDWTGSDVAPTLDVIFNYADAAKKLTLGYDADAALSTYIIDRDAADTGAGDKTIKITPASNDLGKYYTGTLTGSYTIEQVDISAATKSDADPLGTVTYTAEDLEYAYTSLVQMPTLEELEVKFGTYALTEDDFTITLKEGSNGIGTGTAVGGDVMTCVVTGKGNFTGSFEVAYTILEADVDALLETAYLEDMADQVFVGNRVEPATKVWVEIDGKYVDESEKFSLYYDTTVASGTARVTATGKDGTVYAGGVVKGNVKVTGDLSKAIMSFSTDADGVLQVQAHFVRSDGTFCEIPASAYTITGVTVNTANSSMTFTAQGVASQFYTGTMTGTTSFGTSMDRNDAAMPADTDGDGILTEAEFNAAFDEYKAQSGYEQGADWGTASMPYSTYQSGVRINATECASMVYQLADWIFGAGSAPTSGAADGVAVGEYDHYSISIDQLRVGDYVYYGTHWVLITGINNGVYSIAEGNYDKAVNYIRTMTAAEFPSETTTFYSRYPYGK